MLIHTDSGALAPREERVAQQHELENSLTYASENFCSHVTVRSPAVARSPVVRTTGTPIWNNSINRYGNPNAIQGFIWKEIAWPTGLLERKNNNKVESFDVIFYVYTHVDNSERAIATD